MNRQDFITTLKKALSFLPENEQREVISDYEEHFRNELASGKNEFQVASDLGNPVDIAEQYRLEKEELAAETQQNAKAEQENARLAQAGGSGAAPEPGGWRSPVVPPIPVPPVRRAAPQNGRPAMPPVLPVPRPNPVPPDYRTVRSAPASRQSVPRQFVPPDYRAAASSQNAQPPASRQTCGAPPPDPFDIQYPPAQSVFPQPNPPRQQQPAAPEKPHKTVLGVLAKIFGVIFYTAIMFFVGVLFLVLIVCGYAVGAALIGGGIYGCFLSIALLNGGGLIAGGFLAGIGIALIGAGVLTAIIKCTGKLFGFTAHIFRHDIQKIKEVLA